MPRSPQTCLFPAHVPSGELSCASACAMPITPTWSPCLSGNVPSDERTTAAYHSHLVEQGQHLQPAALMTSLNDIGAEKLAVGRSTWRLSPDDPLQPYLVDFLAAGAAPALWASGWDAAAWRASVLRRGATVVVDNLDLLYRLPTHCILHTTYYILHTTYYILHTAYYILHTTHYILGSPVHAPCRYILLATYYLLLTTYYFLLTTFYLLLTTYY